jgi:hypothetical protein
MPEVSVCASSSLSRGERRSRVGTSPPTPAAHCLVHHYRCGCADKNAEEDHGGLDDRPCAASNQFDKGTGTGGYALDRLAGDDLLDINTGVFRHALTPSPYPSLESRLASCRSHALVQSQRSKMGRCRSSRAVSHERSPLPPLAFRTSAPRFERARTRRRRSTDASSATERARSTTDAASSAKPVRDSRSERTATHALHDARKLTDESIKFRAWGRPGTLRGGSASAASRPP